MSETLRISQGKAQINSEGADWKNMDYSIAATS
jgi:hypothetical protein